MPSTKNRLDRRSFLKLGAMTSGLAIGGCSRAESLADDRTPLEMQFRDLGATGLSLGMIFAGFSMARFLVTPFIGRMSDRSGRRIFLATGLLLFSGFSLLYMSAQTVVHWTRSASYRTTS